MAFIDATVVNIAFPNIEHSFKGTSISTLSWVLNAYNIVFAAFLLPAGKFADLIGRKRMFIIGVELFTFASLLCAIAPSPGLLIAFRAMQALGAACLVPAALSLVLNAFPPHQRSHGVALLAAVGAASSGIGPTVGGLLIAASDWRLVFLINIPVGVVAVVLARRKLIESRTPGRRRMPDLVASLLFAIAVAALVLGVVKGQEWGWSSPRIIASFAVAVVLVGLVVWRCTWHRAPMIDLPLLRNRTFSVANTATIVTGAGLYGYSLANVLFLTGVWHYSVLKAGLALTPGPFAAAAAAELSSAVVQRIGHRAVLIVGGLIWGGGLVWLIERATVTPQYVSVFLPGVLLLGVGTGMFFPNLTGAAVASAPGESYGGATGLNSVGRQVGGALGVALVVAIIGTPSPLQALRAFQDAWTFGAVCLFAAAIGSLLIGPVIADKAPSLSEATRYILRHGTGDDAVADRPRSRRALVLDPAAAAASAHGQSISEFLAEVPLFVGLEPGLRELLAARTTQIRVAAGEWLFHQGEPGDAMYVVRTGRLEVVDESTAAVVRELGRGDAVGELALLTASPRSASVRAARSTDLLTIGRAEFERLLQATPAISLALNRVLAEELRDTRAPSSTARPLPTTVALAGLDERVPVAELARGLARELGRDRRAALLDGRDVAPPGDGEAAAVYGPVLDRAEAEHDLVLLDAGSIVSPTAWTEFCLQQADRILAGTVGGPLPDALQTRPELRGCDVVAYNITPGAGALGGWADALDPLEFHLIRGDKLDEDLARMARRLTGRSLGIVLSGGGARAFAHIGVLEELAGAGLVIDRVAGVSIGAYIGALFAMGLEVDEIDARCFEEWVQRRPLSDYTIPRHALIRGGRVEAMLQRTFGEAVIEELPRSYMCGYTELRSGALVMARSGSLRERVGFSMCLPVIAPPAVRGRELFIDGSLVDNLPVKAMSDLGEGPVIAVDVKATFEPGSNGAPPEAGASSNGAARPPSLGETLTRVVLLGTANTSDAARRYADVVISPRADGVGLLEFHQLDAAREAGRAAAREALESASGASFA
jgi:EmrB/QacA subfamily drug resistance transporter